MIYWIVGLSLALLAVLYILSTRSQRCRSGFRKLRPWAYAHRGLHGPGRPENSMSAFRAALSAGYGVELDAHLLKDGNLAVIHDYSLERTTGAEGRVEELSTEDLWKYNLEDTSETIPTLGEVLDLLEGRIPVILELKADKNNVSALTQAACEMMDTYPGPYCIESFDPRVVRWLRKNRPDILRGQLTENYFKTKESKLPFILKFVLSRQMMNFVTRPDFVAYRYRDRRCLSNFLVKKLWGTPRVTWTVETLEDFKTARKEGWIPIFENFQP